MKAPKAQGKDKEAYGFKQRGNDMNKLYNAAQGENYSKIKKQMKKD